MKICRKPKYTGLTFSEVKKYIAYAAKALKNNGFIEIHFNENHGPIKLVKKEHIRKEDEITLRITAGDHSRKHLSETSEILTRNGIDHKMTLTKKKKLPQHLCFSIPAESPMVSSAAGNFIDTFISVLGVENPASFSVTCWGFYKPGFSEHDGEVIEKPKSYSVGFYLGHLTGNIVRLFKK